LTLKQACKIRDNREKTSIIVKFITYFRDFCLSPNGGIPPQLSYNCLFLNPFQFVIHQSSQNKPHERPAQIPIRSWKAENLKPDHNHAPCLLVELVHVTLCLVMHIWSFKLNYNCHWSWQRFQRRDRLVTHSQVAKMQQRWRCLIQWEKVWRESRNGCILRYRCVAYVRKRFNEHANCKKLT
jgi:hypothetical protein